MATYSAEIWLVDEGYQSTEGIEAETDEEALDVARQTGIDCVWEDGDYPDEGYIVKGHVTVTRDDDDDEVGRVDFEVTIEPNKDALARAAGLDTDCDHGWEEIKGSVRSHGGTTFSGWEHCSDCGGLKRWETHGSQRNPGEVDTLEFFANPEAAEAAGYGFIDVGEG